MNKSYQNSGSQTFERQNSEKLNASLNTSPEFKHIEIIMPASEEGSATLEISNVGNFDTDSLTGTYTDSAGSGKCQVLINLTDTGLNRKISNRFFPVNLFLTPGLTGNLAGNNGQLIVPYKFPYFFQNNSNILIEWKNLSTSEETLNLFFRGNATFKRN